MVFQPACKYFLTQYLVCIYMSRSGTSTLNHLYIFPTHSTHKVWYFNSKSSLIYFRHIQHICTMYIHTNPTHSTHMYIHTNRLALSWTSTGHKDWFNRQY